MKIHFFLNGRHFSEKVENEKQKIGGGGTVVIYTYILSFIQIQLMVLELEGFKEKQIVT